MVNRIMVVGALTHCTLLHFMCNLKSSQMNVQYSLIQELRLYKFELGHNTTESTKNICCAKDEGAIDHSAVTRWFKKFYLGFKNLNNQTRPGRPKSIDSEVVLQAIEINLVSRTGRVSGKHSISHSS